MIGRTLLSYRVVEKLGGGGIGQVYLSRDERLGRDVALKVLPEGRLEDERARSRFRQEAQALLRLSHPHVATLLDFGSENDTDYLVMERVSGPTLAEELRRGSGRGAAPGKGGGEGRRPPGRAARAGSRGSARGGGGAP